MQSILRMGWSDIMGENKADAAQYQKIRPSPIMDMSIFNKLKRKRTDSPELMRSPSDLICKRQKLQEGADWPSTSGQNLDQAEAPPKQAVTETTDVAQPSPGLTAPVSGQISPFLQPSDTSAPSAEAQKYCLSTKNEQATKVQSSITPYSSLDTTSAMSPLQQIIEQQFNTEILVKHREIRLIEQELAKCQTALEQLRRCELIQYPGFSSLSEEAACGAGPSLRPQPGSTQPSAPAPWGATDGPYTRHYAKWLLPDSTFDSLPAPQVQPAFDPFARGDNRTMRISGVSAVKPGKSRANRDSISSLAGQMPAVGPVVNTPRSKGGPLVLKRLSDNQFVKLVCKECHRGDFSSVQGFLNHCRIAHKLDYKSHEAAAQDCGRLLEAHEQDLAVMAPPPVGSTTRSSVPKPSAPLPVSTKVHSLNHATTPLQPPRPTWKHQRLTASVLSKLASMPTPSTSSTRAAQFHASPLVPSSSTPFLSAQFAKRGLGGDLQEATSMAREKIDLGADYDGDGDEGGSTQQSPAGNASMASRTVSGVSTAFAPERPASRKGHRQPAVPRPRPAPLAPSSLKSHSPHSEIPESPQDTELSPHTADSNPGLVSDHDDDSISEPEEETHSVVAAPALHMTRRECGDATEVDVELEIEDENDRDGHGVLIRRRDMLPRHDEQMRGSGSPSRPRVDQRQK